MITFTHSQFSGIMFLWFAVIVGLSYSAGMLGYRLGRRDRAEDGPAWDDDSLAAVRGDQDGVRLPDSSWLDTVPLSQVVRERPPGGQAIPPRPLDRATDVIAAITAETDAFIASMRQGS